MNKIRTHYDNLGVSRTAQPEVIKAAYKALAQKYHPDRNPDNPDAERIMKIINTAYQVLIDPVRRAEHDRWIDEQERAYQAQNGQSKESQSSQNFNQKSNNNNSSFYDYTGGQSHQSNQKDGTQNHHNNRTNTGGYYDYTDTKTTNSNQSHQYSQNGDVINKPSFWSFGRMRRTTYVLWSIPVLIILLIMRAGMEGAVSGMQNYDVATLSLVTIIEFLPWMFLVFIGIKRLHDCDYKGWWILMPFVVIVIWFVRPTKGANRFGADPRDKYFDGDIDIEEDYSFWGIIVICLILNIGLISQAVNMQEDVSDNQDYQATQTYHETDNDISFDDIDAPNPNNESQLNPKAVLVEAEKDYNNAVADINAVWNSLHPSTQEFLRAEQRAINKKREADCIAYGNSQNSDKDLAKAYRYACEVSQLNERAEYLKTQLNTVVTPPTPKKVGPAYQQSYQSKDDVVLSQMMNIYNNPQSAPAVYLCQGDVYCNAFLALSQYWVYIPDNYRYQGNFNIKYQAEIGDAHGLNKGFTLNKEQSILLAEGGDLSNVGSGGNAEQEKTFAEGLAVLLYIEDMNGWL